MDSSIHAKQCGWISCLLCPLYLTRCHHFAWNSQVALIFWSKDAREKGDNMTTHWTNLYSVWAALLSENCPRLTQKPPYLSCHRGIRNMLNITLAEYTKTPSLEDCAHLPTFLLHSFIFIGYWWWTVTVRRNIRKAILWFCTDYVLIAFHFLNSHFNFQIHADFIELCNKKYKDAWSSGCNPLILGLKMWISFKFYTWRVFLILLMNYSCIECNW